MQLLNAQEIKKDKEKGVRERMERIGKLNNAETKVTKELNQKRSAIALEKKHLDENLELHRQYITAKKEELTAEVESLESRRADALKPINQQKKEVENRLSLADEKEARLSERSRGITEREETLLERTDSLSSKKDELDDRESSLNRTIFNIQKQEESTKKSLDSLNQSWTDFHKKVHTINTELEVRERVVDLETKSNLEFQSSLQKKERDLAEYKIKLLDERGTLDRAWNELKLKQQNHG